MSEFTFKDLGKEKYTQDDGAEWSTFFDKKNPDRRFLIVTSSGRELLLGKDLPYAALKRHFRKYRIAEGAEKDVTTRDFLGKGNQAEVFGLDSSKLAVRETPGTRPFYTTMRGLSYMDELATVVEGGLPRWIKIPHTYALYSDDEAHKQYTLMDKIDSGVTVADITAFDEATPHSKERVLREFGHKPTPQEAADADRLFNKAGHILNTVIKAQGRNPEELLTDWYPRNAIIEPLSTPIAGERYQLNIIDQNDQN